MWGPGILQNWDLPHARRKSVRFCAVMVRWYQSHTSDDISATVQWELSKIYKGDSLAFIRTVRLREGS